MGDDSRSESPSGQSPGDTLTLRALVTTKEAGVVIGKGGANVAKLRDETGVKAGVSKVVPGVHERVLSISGPVKSVADAYANIIAQLLVPEALNGAPSGSPVVPPSHTSLRLLISHNLMGTIIGRQGLKIKAIQDASGARMIASKDMLPQSTERIVEVQGTAEGIGRAVEEIGTCLLEDWERGLGTVLYHPGAEGKGDTGIGKHAGASGTANRGGAGRRDTGNRRGASAATNGNGSAHPNVLPSSSSPPSSPPPTTPRESSTPAGYRTQNISIPSDMVGCIIGRQGSKITEIRRLSGSKISIAKVPHDDTGERMFTIVGTPEANEKALFLLYNQLETEKERRVGKENAAAASAVVAE